MCNVMTVSCDSSDWTLLNPGDWLNCFRWPQLNPGLLICTHTEKRWHYLLTQIFFLVLCRYFSQFNQNIFIEKENKHSLFWCLIFWLATIWGVCDSVGGSGSRMIWRILIMMMMMMMMMVGGSQSTDLTSGDGVMINYRKTGRWSTERELFVIDSTQDEYWM